MRYLKTYEKFNVGGYVKDKYKSKRGKLEDIVIDYMSDPKNDKKVLRFLSLKNIVNRYANTTNAHDPNSDFLGMFIRENIPELIKYINLF